MLAVTLYNAEGKSTAVFDDLVEDGQIGLGTVDFVSLISPETYGKPALVAPGKPGDSRADIGQRVLYINTSLVPSFEIERTSD